MAGGSDGSHSGGGIFTGESPVEGLPLLLLQIASVILVVQLLSWVFKKIKQPVVIAEVSSSWQGAAERRFCRCTPDPASLVA